MSLNAFCFFGIVVATATEGGGRHIFLSREIVVSKRKPEETVVAQVSKTMYRLMLIRQRTVEMKCVISVETPSRATVSTEKRMPRLLIGDLAVMADG
jgi:hypothetical protein